MPEALNDVLDLAKNLGGILMLVFYASIVLWTYKDARRRIDDPILIATSVATSMLPIVGVLVYMLLRPPEYLADVRERELEIRAMERTLGRQERCPYCRSHIEHDYLSCPVCMSKLRQSCNGCDKPLDPRWAMCPFCEIEVPRAEDLDPRGGRGGSRPAPRRAAPTTGGTTTKRAPAKGASSASKPATKPSAPRRSEKADKPRDTDKGGSDINIEPFNSAGTGPRFVRSEQPTMIHTGSPIGTGPQGETR